MSKLSYETSKHSNPRAPLVRRGRRSRAETNSRLISAATRLFSANEYQSVTIRQIAAQAKVALPAVYRLFENKRALYIECCKQELQTDLPLLHEALIGCDSPEEVLYASTLALFIWSSKDDRHIIMRAIMDNDTYMLEDAANRLFDSEYISQTISAAKALAGKKDPILNLIFVHSLIYAAPQIGSFWGAGAPSVFERGDTRIVVHILATVFPDADWEKIAAKISSTSIS